MESHHFIQTGKLLSLSEQEVVDCGNTCPDDKKTGLGCSGGDETCALEWLKIGQTTEDKYPYQGKDGVCDKSKFADPVVKTKKVVKVKEDSPSQMAVALMKGPVTVAVYVDDIFHQYSSGIFNSKHCIEEGGSNMNHAIAAVGFGIENDQKYWIVRNSWSTSWGEEGYIRMQIVDGAGICNVQKIPSFAYTS